MRYPERDQQEIPFALSLQGRDHIDRISKEEPHCGARAEHEQEKRRYQEPNSTPCRSSHGIESEGGTRMERRDTGVKGHKRVKHNKFNEVIVSAMLDLRPKIAISIYRTPHF